MDDKRINRLRDEVVASVRKRWGKMEGSAWSILSPTIRYELVMSAVLTRIRARDAEIHSDDMDKLVNAVVEVFGKEIN